jgi:hypothetical protein
VAPWNKRQEAVKSVQFTVSHTQNIFQGRWCILIWCNIRPRFSYQHKNR